MRRPESLCTFTSGGTSDDSTFCCKELYLKQHPHLLGEVVVIHVIPLSAEDVFAEERAIDMEELHSIRNLRAVKLSDLNSDLLQGFRQDWKNYLTDHLTETRSHLTIGHGVTYKESTRGELLDYAASLLEKYQALFVQ